MSRPSSSLTTAAQETIDLFNDDPPTTVSFRASKLSYASGAPIFGSAAPRLRTLSKIKEHEDHRAKRDSPTLPQAWRRTVSEGVGRSSSLSSPPSTSTREIPPHSNSTASSFATTNGNGTSGIPGAGSGMKTPSRVRAGSKSSQSTPNSTPHEPKRPDSPDIETILSKTPRPRRRSSAIFPSHSHSHSLHSIPPSLGRRRSPQSNSHSSLSLRSLSSGAGTLKRDLNALGGGAGDDDSLISDYGSILEGDSPFEDLESLGMEMDLDDGSESDSSIDMHTPLPHLMFRDGLLSPRSKLLPQSLKQPSYPDLGADDRSKSVLSIASTVGSAKTKSGLQKDPRHTERRRVRHRDGQLLRAGMGLTTGLGWSDSEDEDAPSALTRKLISTTIERKRSTTLSAGPSPPLGGFGGSSRPSSGYESQEKGLPRYSSPHTGSARRTPSIGGLRSASISFPASSNVAAVRREIPVPIKKEILHMRTDSSSSDSPRSNATPTPLATSISPTSSVVASTASQDDIGLASPRQRVDSTASEASASTSRILSRSSSYSASIYSTSTANRLESPPTSNVVLPPARIRKESTTSVSTAHSNGIRSRAGSTASAAENVPFTRQRTGSSASATSQSTNHSKTRSRNGSGSSNTPPSSHRLPRSLSKAQSLDTIASAAESRVSVVSAASSGSTYSHQSGGGGPSSSSGSGSSHSTVPRPLKLPQTIGMGNSFVRSFSQGSSSVYSSTPSTGSNGEAMSHRTGQLSNSSMRSYMGLSTSPPLQSSISSPPLSARTMSPPLSGGTNAPGSPPGSGSPRPRPQGSPVGARPRPRTGTGMAYRTSSGVEYRTSAYGIGATSFVGDPSARMRSLSLAAAAVRESGNGLTKSTSGSGVNGNKIVGGVVSGRNPVSVGTPRPSPSGMVGGKF